MKTRIQPHVILVIAALLLSGCVSTGGRDTSDFDAARANTDLALRYLQRGDVDVAMEKVDKALEQDDDHADAHLVKGMILARAEDWREADRHYRRAARLAGDNLTVRSNVAAYMCERGKHRDGEEMFVAVARNPINNRPAVGYTNAGLCAKRIPALDRAESHFRRALELESNYAPALRQMAEVKLEQGEFLAARAFLQRLEGVQRLGPDALLLGVRIERGMEDPAAARRYADILMRDFPGSREADALLAESEPQG